ncbi:MAG: hypothetical protein ACK5TK_04870 [Betaproteobacteria bacterium]
MNYVNERISDADQARINWGVFDGIPHIHKYRPFKWTIREDRNVFLTLLPRRGYDDTQTRPELFALWWCGEIVLLEASNHSESDKAGNLNLIWKLINVSLPINLESKKSEIFQNICDALKAHGFLYDNSGYRAVDVQI